MHASTPYRATTFCTTPCPKNFLGFQVKGLPGERGGQGRTPKDGIHSPVPRQTGDGRGGILLV